MTANAVVRWCDVSRPFSWHVMCEAVSRPALCRPSRSLRSSHSTVSCSSVQHMLNLMPPEVCELQQTCSLLSVSAVHGTRPSRARRRAGHGGRSQRDLCAEWGRRGSGHDHHPEFPAAQCLLLLLVLLLQLFLVGDTHTHTHMYVHLM